MTPPALTHALVLSAILLSLGGCQTDAPHMIVADAQPPAASPTPTRSPTPANTPPAAQKISDLSASDLRDVLAELNKGHHDKMQLAWWVNAPLLRSADPVFKKFYKEQGDRQKELATELEAWAKLHHIDLTYRYTDDTFSKAQKIMEQRQEKTVRADNKEDFGRDMLIDEFQDYEFGISLITALLPSIHDPALQTYLQKNLHAQEAGDAQIQTFLKKYKFTG